MRDELLQELANELKDIADSYDNSIKTVETSECYDSNRTEMTAYLRGKKAGFEIASARLMNEFLQNQIKKE